MLRRMAPPPGLFEGAYQTLPPTREVVWVRPVWVGGSGVVCGCSGSGLGYGLVWFEVDVRVVGWEVL